MLFKDYDQITYNLGNKTVTVSDIFRHITFDIQNSSPNAFYDYYIQDGETPENVSLKLYGSTAYSWLVLLVNGLADRNEDWFISQDQYSQKKELDFGGDAFYITSLPDVKSGDIMVKVTSVSEETATNINSSVYRIVKDFDKNLRKIRGSTGSGTFSSGDNILFARYNFENGSVSTISFLNGATYPELTDYTPIVYTEKYGASVDYFYSQPDADSTSKVIINPFKNVINGSTATNVSTGVLYSNSGDTTTLENFTNTLVYRYASYGASGYGYSKKTIDQSELETYLNKQKIKVLRSEYLSSVVLAIKTALSSDEIGKTFKVTI